MKVLVINGGSSSLKYQVIEMADESVICKGLVERIGQNNARLVYKKTGSENFETTKPILNHTDALKEVINVLLDANIGIIKSMDEIKAVGHRVLHSGEDFKDSVLIDDEVIAICKKNEVLGPLHMPANIACIESCRSLMPSTPMVAVFDTGFHLTMPKYAYMYGIPYADYEQYKIRKYGFHGTSHKFVSNCAMEYLGTDKCRIVTCHLGNGSSVAAVKDGKCVDTSMGLTPLEGLVMGTRSGDLDPAVVEFMCKCKNITVEQCLHILNKESGFLGIAGASDNRDLCDMAAKGDERAQLALDMFAYRVKKYIGSYVAAMGGLDCVVFTGGIGENSDVAREMVMKGMECFGIDFDFEHNKTMKRGTFAELNTKNSKVKVLVIPTNEELVIARDAVRLSGLNN